MAVWIGPTSWVSAELWTKVHPTTDRDTYLVSVLDGDGTSTATLTGGPQTVATLSGDGISVATLLVSPPLTATLLINN